MSRDTEALLDALERLSVEEMRAFTQEVLRRSLPFDSGPLDDEEIGTASAPCSSPCRDQRRRSGAKRCSALRRHGEVWLIDFGRAGKARPALIVSGAFGDQDRALITVIPHTSSLRGSAFEVAVPVPFLKPGAFLVQGATAFPSVWYCLSLNL